MANPQPNIWHAPMPLICSSFEPGHLDGAIEAMPDSDYRTIALAEAAYFRGKADEACRLAEPFLTSDVLALRISSCFHLRVRKPIARPRPRRSRLPA